MARTREVACRSTGESIHQMPCTTPKSNKCAKRPPTPSSSSSESESSESESESRGDKINTRKRPCTTPSGTRPSKRPAKYVPSSSSESEEASAMMNAKYLYHAVRIRQVPRRSTGDTSPPKKRPCTTPDAKSPESVVDIPNSTCESDKSREAEPEMMPREEKAGPKFDFNVFLSHLDKDMPESFIAPLDWNEANAGEVSREEYDQALKDRDLGKTVLKAEKKALTERLDKEFSNFAAELKEVLESLSKSKAELEKTSQERDTYKNSFELGNRVWEAERIEMAKNIEMVNKEMQNALELRKKVAEAERTETAETIAISNKEKEKAYCKGYLDGFVKKPHAYVHVWHDARLANEVNDLPVLQMMNNLPVSHV